MIQARPDSDRAARGAFFDRQAGAWSQVHYGPRGSMRARIERFATALKQRVASNAEVLDYGCGTGEIAAALAALGYRVEACDISARMIECARSLHEGSGVRFSLTAPRPGDGDVDLPISSARFDAIVCSSVLEYVHDLPRSLRALSDVLKPGGWLLATVPDIGHPARRGEDCHRRLMANPLLRRLIRLTPLGANYELQWLSRNRMPADDWIALFRGAQLDPVWRDEQDHPLLLLAGCRRA